MEPLDQLFGEGAAISILQGAVVDGATPTIVQTWLPDDSLQVVFNWGTFSQIATFDQQKNSVWGNGLCTAPNPDAFEQFLAGQGALCREFGLKTVSVYAPEPYTTKFLKCGLHRSSDNWDVLIGETTPNSDMMLWIAENE